MIPGRVKIRSIVGHVVSLESTERMRNYLLRRKTEGASIALLEIRGCEFSERQDYQTNPFLPNEPIWEIRGPKTEIRKKPEIRRPKAVESSGCSRFRTILPNEANGPGDPKLPNEPIPASHSSQISHLSAQTTGKLPNEPTVEPG